MYAGDVTYCCDFTSPHLEVATSSVSPEGLFMLCIVNSEGQFYQSLNLVLSRSTYKTQPVFPGWRKYLHASKSCAAGPIYIFKDRLDKDPRTHNGGPICHPQFVFANTVYLGMLGLKGCLFAHWYFFM